MDSSLIDSLFGGKEEPSSFANRFLEGEKVEIVDPAAEKKKAIEAARKAKIRTPEEEEERTGRTLFIGNIPAKFDNDDVKRLCKEFGPIESVRIRNLQFKEDRKVNKKVAVRRGDFDKTQNADAYVVFKNVEDRDKAIVGLKNKEVEGFTLRTDKATPKNVSEKISNEESNRTVFIGQLKPTVTEDMLRKLFSNAGEIDHVKIPRDRETGKSRYVAYVTFVDERSVDDALKFDGTFLEEKQMRVERSTPRKAAKKKAEIAAKEQKKREDKQNKKFPKKEKKEEKKEEEGEEKQNKNKNLSFMGQTARPQENKNKKTASFLKLKAHQNKKNQKK
ncbi:hypothetical protein TVAG_108440 [Trichomonas vaginalis G3]|uniref:RRM domain-containing protein n=1 Tax=Trichomonas vaginalis (strain ATCC PRA-98 / G3) TaxID=412133 RepID=A2EQG8_TRIV3|nr:RNA binding [Trichomonas vaginalis G3]EAY05110.1 hypothetical protein TVAG_108440 [Trichomonas vaginalis G3]KAI5551460.1 RNA binding [Trichomonas vaginalis G3]|eukprot:XP_001317333.1 hypothetical protein [Trichomonas vaginalis G3]